MKTPVEKTELPVKTKNRLVNAGIRFIEEAFEMPDDELREKITLWSVNHVRRLQGSAPQAKTVSRANPKVSPEADEFLAGLFKSRNQGAEWAIEAMPRLVRMTLAREIKGMFTRLELVIILEASPNDPVALFDGRLGENLLPNVVEFLEANKVWPRSGRKTPAAVGNRLLEKIRRLTLFQAAALEVWAGQYHSGNVGREMPWVETLMAGGGDAAAAEVDGEAQ